MGSSVLAISLACLLECRYGSESLWVTSSASLNHSATFAVMNLAKTDLRSAGESINEWSFIGKGLLCKKRKNVHEGQPDAQKLPQL
jgi:hypothetical protein